MRFFKEIQTDLDVFDLTQTRGGNILIPAWFVLSSVVLLSCSSSKAPATTPSLATQSSSSESLVRPCMNTLPQVSPVESSFSALCLQLALLKYRRGKLFLWCLPLARVLVSVFLVFIIT